jgi:hypothetical protein
LLPLLLLSLLQLRSPDTLKLGPLNEGIAGNVAPDAQLLGPPQVQFRTGQGSVSVWLLIRRDTVLIAANIQDSTPYWGDDFVISFDRRGDGGPSPQHDGISDGCSTVVLVLLSSAQTRRTGDRGRADAGAVDSAAASLSSTLTHHIH